MQERESKEEVKRDIEKSCPNIKTDKKTTEGVRSVFLLNDSRHSRTWRASLTVLQIGQKILDHFFFSLYHGENKITVKP